MLTDATKAHEVGISKATIVNSTTTSLTRVPTGGEDENSNLESIHEVEALW